MTTAPPTRVANPRELGLVVREHRRAMGLTQEEAASRAGVSRRWLSLVERGAPRSELALVLRLLRSLGLRISLSADSGPDARAPAHVDLDALLCNTVLGDSVLGDPVLGEDRLRGLEDRG